MIAGLPKPFRQVWRQYAEQKLNMRVLRHSLMIASTISVLTGCDYFTDNWEIRNGACQAISSEGNETALISDEGMVFMSMDKGCPDNLDFPGTRFITTRINDQTWKSLMVCNSATGFRRMVTLGIPPCSAGYGSPCHTGFHTLHGSNRYH